MNILLYFTSSAETGNQLAEGIKALVSREQIAICRSIETLSTRLRQYPGDRSVALLVPATLQEISELLSIHQLFGGIRIILILPDDKPDTVSLGLKLYPRFLTYADSNFEDVIAVLGKMLDQSVQTAMRILS